MTDRIEALERLARLKTEGVLTDAEFEQQKQFLLGQGAPSASSIEPEPEPMGAWATSWHQTRGMRRVFRWFWGIQLLAIVLIGAYFLLRVLISEPRPTADAAETNAAAPAEDNAAAPEADAEATETTPVVGEAEPYASTEITILDATLANPWTFDGETTDANNSSDVCPRSAVTLVNRSSEALKLHLSEQETAHDVADLPNLEPGMKVTFKVGKVGGYVMSRENLTVLYLLNVVNCPPND
ncbi:SHOCT domain-containing protein [Sphingomonas crocodyli]|uniref:SHOCT domain-containing protein n=1 Tax=Sphingomonas crocodyli TaxID=1979270 RepID=A0A437M5L2_9SPHN|nr:SHOCT domain-containing protein [Sphingomonas crocodyli]RVT92988.1 SHOCT domain-containing protein [Sphingomonas crocodyli]